MLFTAALKTARMQAVTRLNSGFLDLMAGAGIAVTLPPHDATPASVAGVSSTGHSLC